MYCITSFAQIRTYDIGAEGGFSLATLRGYPFNNKKTIKYSGGIFFQKNLNKIISIRTGAYFEQKGSSFEIQDQYIIQGNADIIHGNAEIDYLTCPLLCRATFGKNFKYFVDAGAYYGFLLRQSTFAESPTWLTRSPLFRNDDAGIIAGLGILYNIKQKVALSLEVRYSRGLVNISKYTLLISDPTITTNATNFLVSFNYKLEHRKHLADSIRLHQRNVYFKLSFAPTFNFMKNDNNTAGIALRSYGDDSGAYYTFDAKREEGNLGHAVSALIEFRLIKQLFLDVGFSSERLNYKTRNNTVFYVTSSWVGHPPSHGYIYVDIEQQYRFISFPLVLNYNIPVNRLSFTLGIGTSYNLLQRFQTTFHDSIYLQVFKYPDLQYKVQNPSSISLIINAGVGYHASKFLELGIETQFKYYFTRGSSTPDQLYVAGFNSRANLYSIGLNFYIKI